MLRRLLPLAAVAVLATAGARAQAPLANPTLAVVHGERIDADAFRSRYVDLLLKSGQRDDGRLRKTVLSSLVAERLLAQEARALGRDTTAAFVREEALLRRRFLLALYAERVAFAPLEVTEAERQDAFWRTLTTVTARHLYARTEAEALRLKVRLDAGETFEALAREVFADTALAHRGGLLPPFSFDEMDPAFEDAAFTLPLGQVSAPVQTEQGFSILRVDARATKPLASASEYATKRDRLDAYVQMRKRTAARAALVEQQKAALALTFDAAGVDALLGQVRGGIVAVPGIEDVRTAPAPQQALWNRPVATFTRGGRRATWTVADVARRAVYASEAARARVRTADDLRAIVTGLAVQEAFVQDAKARSLDQDDEYSRALQSALDRALVQDYAAALRAVPVPEDSVRAFYARYANDFLQAPTAEVSEILVDDAALAHRLRAQLDAGADFAALARVHTVRPGGRQNGGQLGAVTQDELGALGASVFEAAPGTVLGPVATGDKVALLRVDRRTPGRVLPYADARPRVHALVQRRLGDRALDAHLATLRDAGGLTFDLPALAALDLYTPATPARPSPAGGR